MNLGKVLGKVFVIFNENGMRTGLELIDMFLRRYNYVLKKLGKTHKEMLYVDLTFSIDRDENYAERVFLIINEVLREYNSVIKSIKDETKLMKKDVSSELEILKGYISVIIDILISLINQEVDLDRFL